MQSPLQRWVDSASETGHPSSACQAYGAVLLARVLTASANAANVARELVGDDRPLGALITMLASWEEPIRLAAVRALAKITWLVRLGPSVQGGGCRPCVLGVYTYIEMYAYRPAEARHWVA